MWRMSIRIAPTLASANTVVCHLFWPWPLDLEIEIAPFRRVLRKGQREASPLSSDQPALPEKPLETGGPTSCREQAPLAPLSLLCV
jgi:hypothetical protein